MSNLTATERSTGQREESIQITARVPAPLVERLDNFSRDTHRSRAGTITYLIERGLQAEQARADNDND